MCCIVMYVHSCRDKQMNIMLRLISIYNGSLIGIYKETTLLVGQWQDYMKNKGKDIGNGGGYDDDNNDDGNNKDINNNSCADRNKNIDTSVLQRKSTKTTILIIVT